MKAHKYSLARLSFFLVLLISMSSCSKEETIDKEIDYQSPFGSAMFKSGMDIDASVYIQGASSGGFLGKIELQGSFKERSGRPSENVMLEVNDVIVPPTGIATGVHHRTLGWDTDEFQNLLVLEGDSVSVSVTNYALGSFNAYTYFPDILKLDSINNPMNLDRNEDLILTWQPERNGVGKILLIMLYRGPFSNQLNPSNPVGRTYQIVELIDHDSGSITVPSSVLLSTFPKHSFVDLFVFRGWSTVVSNDDKKLLEVVNFSFDGMPLIFDN